MAIYDVRDDTRTITRYFPVLATILIELASIGQIVQMYREQSSVGHNPLSWTLLVVALILWERFYTICTPNERPAIWTARVSVLMYIFVLGSVLYFR
jgi:uncharacterized protein with PQ loop repeat